MRQEPLERDLERTLKRGVRLIGGIAEKVTPVSSSGIPDRLVILPGGRIILVELKRHPGAELRPIQTQYHDKLRRLGVEPVIIDGMETLRNQLSAWRRLPETASKADPDSLPTPTPSKGVES